MKDVAQVLQLIMIDMSSKFMVVWLPHIPIVVASFNVPFLHKTIYLTTFPYKIPVGTSNQKCAVMKTKDQYLNQCQHLPGEKKNRGAGLWELLPGI